MQDTTLYQSILGLTHPWAVSSVELNEATQTITVRVDYDRASLTACPACSKAVRRHDTRRRVWRHLDTCQFETRIEAEVPRADCPEHGVQTLQVPWAASNSRYTELFETRVIAMLKVSSLYAVSKTYRLSWGAIDRIMARGVQRGLTARTTINYQDLLVDETAFKKGHDYVTVLSNRDGQVIAVEDGRAGLSLSACFKALPPESTMHTRSISMDMSRAYINAAYDYFGERAKQMIERDPLVGGLFENLVVLEALKSRTHRGHDPSLYFFRDHNGREVDLLYPDGNQVIPIEIKSAQTFDASFAKGVHYFQKLSNSDHRGRIIYAGDSEFVTDQYEVSNFKSAFDV